MSFGRSQGTLEHNLIKYKDYKFDTMNLYFFGTFNGKAIIFRHINYNIDYFKTF